MMEEVENFDEIKEYKAKGNYHFERAEYDDALEYYEKALTHLDETWKSDERPRNIQQFSIENRNLRSACLKNQAACFLKRDRYDEAVRSCTRAIFYTPNDTKAMYRRIIALEKMNAISQAYTQARNLHRLTPKDKAVEKLTIHLRDIIEIKTLEERSTEKRVNNMFDVLVSEGALYKGGEKDVAKMKTAADNLIVLARDEAGAERIFREGGLDLLNHLLDSNVSDLYLSAIRTLGYLAEGHKSRTTVILDTIKVDRIKEHIGQDREDISTAATNLLQTIMNSYKSQHDKADHRNANASVVFDYSTWISGLVKMFTKMLNDRSVSAAGRDNTLTLLTRNVPRTHYETRYQKDPESYLCFRSVQGLERLLAVASWSFDHTSAQEVFDEANPTPEKAPLAVTKNTQLNCAVCLLRFYDECGSDERRLDFIECCKQYIQYLFSHNINGLDLLLNLRGITVATTLLLGPDDVGFKILAQTGLFEVMIAMTGDANEVSQITAIEAILAAINKSKNATFVMENGTTLLKKLYKNSKLDSVRIRALVGLCKVGSSHGSDVSRKVFADGSAVKLARQCRKFLIGGKESLKKWAVEGLAYLTLDADVKEELCSDEKCLEALSVLTHTSTDMTVAYPTIQVFTNCTNSAEKTEEPIEEMKEIMKFAKHHVPENHEKDSGDFVKVRTRNLVKSKLVSTLAVFSNSDHALITEGLRELVTRILLTAADNPENRGLIMSHGGGKTLLTLARRNNTLTGKLIAAQGVARLAITTNPKISFPGQQTFEAIGSLLQLMKCSPNVEVTCLMNFEGLMALTNLASLDDDHRRKIIDTKEMIPSIESHALSEHFLVRRAAVQLMCNLCSLQKYRDKFLPDKDGLMPTCDRFKMIVLMCKEDDDDTRSAAAGALATLTNYEAKLCQEVRHCCETWLESLEVASFDTIASIRLRGLSAIRNISEQCIETCELMVNSNLKNIIIGMSKDVPMAWPIEDKEDEDEEPFVPFTSDEKSMLSKLCKEILDTWIGHKLIQSTSI